jgi:hypothetical protein
MKYELSDVSANKEDNTLTYNGELSRLITAAVVNQKFCNLLLTDPQLALATGYKGEVFQLTQAEYRLILAIKAASLADFATQLAQSLNGGINGHNSNGNGRSNTSNGHNGHDNGNGTLEEQ